MRRITKTVLSLLGVTALAVNANEWAVLYTGEAAHNASGGLKTGDAYLGNLDITAQWLDINWLAPDASVFVYVLGNHGDSPSELIGDAQTFSNIDAPQTIKLYELWFEQPFADGHASFKLGLIDLNSEFDVIDSAGVFQNSSFGIGPDFSQSGGNGPSIFPTTSFGFRFATALSANTYGQCILLDGVPGDPDNEKGTHIRFDSGDGVLLTCETGYRANAETLPDGVSKLALGSWRYSEESVTLDGDKTKKNSGIYVLGERSVWRHNERRLDVFARVGIADDDINVFARYIGSGAVLNGVFAEDLSDQIGFGVACVESSAAFRAAAAALDQKVDRREITIELVYRYVVSDWLTVQPSLQHIKNPGMDPGLDDATAVALRFEIGHGGEF